MLIDSHCHLHDQEFFSADQAEEILKRARYNHVEKIIVIGTDEKDSLAAHDFAIKHDDVYWTFGIHPSECRNLKTALPKICEELIKTKQTKHEPVKTSFKAPDNLNLRSKSFEHDPTNTSSEAPEELFKTPPIAIGEIGLDYHYTTADRTPQIKLFHELLNLAVKVNLPVSFHVREAFDDFFPIIKNFPSLTGVVHSFSDSKKTLKRLLTETNFYIGVNGMATYSTLPLPPLERILLETDAPFLTPKPFRGIINEPAHVRKVADFLAERFATNPDQIAERTTENARKLFHF